MQHDSPACRRLTQHPTANTTAARSAFSLTTLLQWLTLLVLILVNLSSLQYE